MNIDTIFLLVCLQLIIISLMSLRVEGREGGSLSFAGHVNRLLDDSDFPPGPSTSRQMRLYSRCSLKHVLVQDKVSATGNTTDFKGELELQTVIVPGRVRTRIHGLYADRYVCFNHKGRLVTKPKKKARGAKCEFVEEFVGAPGYSQFRSAKNKDWFIGFNPRGRPYLASDYLITREKNCFDFLKIPPELPRQHHRHHSNMNLRGKHLNFPEKFRRHKKYNN